jgi:hypothetical protein
MNFVELMEFHRSFYSLPQRNLDIKPKLQVLYDHKKGYSVCINEENCDSQLIFRLERMAAIRGLILEKMARYWVICCPETY